jgi:guanylate kinase
MESGKDAILRVDVQGAVTIRNKCPEAVLIFLTAGDEDEIIRRLKARHTETEEKLKVRIQTMMKEKEYIPLFDYLVVNKNGSLDRAVDDVISIITAEHCRVHHRKVTL